MKKIHLVSVIVAVLVISGFVVTYSLNNNQADSPKSADSGKSNESMMKDKNLKMDTENQMMDDKQVTENKDNVMMKDDKTMEKMDDQMKETVTSDKDKMMKIGTYQEYSLANKTTAFEQNNKVVLFFHAKWCPECKKANAEFNAKLSEIPAGVTVLKTDYDSNSDLKIKYGVTYQHTFVQIDKNGNQITKWNGGDIDNLKKNIK